MTTPDTSPGFNPAAPSLGSAPLRAPAAAPEPADRAELSGRRAASRLAREVLKPAEKGPVKPELLATWHYRADEDHTIDEVFRLPDGRQVLVAHSFDTDRDRSEDPGGYAEAFGPDGRRLWRFDADGGYQVLSLVFVSDGSTYVVEQPQDPTWRGSRLVALDRHGVRQWTHEGEQRGKIDSVRRGPDGTLFVKEGRRLTALAPDGSPRWSKELSSSVDDFFHLQAPDGTQIFAGDNFSNNFGWDHFTAVGPDGQVRDLDWPDIGTFPLHLGDLVVYGGEEGEVHGIDLATGKRWEAQTESLRGHKMPFAGPDGRIYLEGRFDDMLYCLSPQGEILWRRKVDDAAPAGGLETPFKPDVDGTVYYATEGGVARILPDGRPGGTIRHSGDLRSFRPGGDGNLYTFDHDGTLGVYDLARDLLFRKELDLAGDWRWEIDDVRPGATVVLRLSDEIYHLSTSRDEELRKALREALTGGGPDEPAPGISEGDGWVEIGDVRLDRY